jgi:hypothetical protein
MRRRFRSAGACQKAFDLGSDLDVGAVFDQEPASILFRQVEGGGDEVLGPSPAVGTHVDQ